MLRRTYFHYMIENGFCYNDFMEDTFEKIFGNKQKVMIVTAHPDDAELFAGGTIARLLKEGKEVSVVKVTSGDKGSRQEKISQQELKDIRIKEDTESMRSLGVKDEDNVYLQFEDGTVDNSMDIIKAIAGEIRRFKPDLIITHNPEDMVIRFAKGVNWINHRDHRNTGKSVIDAAYPYSRDLLFFPDQLEKGLTSHICSEFLLVDYYDGPDIVAVDVTDFIDDRVTAHAKHASQYSREDAQSSADFFTKFDGTDRRYERFRYVVAD